MKRTKGKEGAFGATLGAVREIPIELFQKQKTKGACARCLCAEQVMNRDSER